MRDLIASQELGRLYSCRMFYGNGTARLVRDSEWRDTEAGVLMDLGSHLLDTARFWFGALDDSFRLYAAHRFENRAPDHVIRRKRVLPSGRPPEEAITLVQEDPTWELEYAYFKKLCTSGAKTDLSNDIWLGRTLGRLSREAGMAGEA